MTDALISNTFTKDERLSGDKRIDTLFSSGNSFIAYPLRVVFLIREQEPENVSVLVSVSKKKFKRAVKRNRVKRLIREAYRLNKVGFHTIISDKNKSLDIAFLYLKNELPTYQEIEAAVKKAASVLTEKFADRGNEVQV